MIWYQDIPIWYGMYAMEGVDQWSLMCTSNVAGNTQMASLDRQVTQNGLVVENAICKGIYNGVVEVTVLCNDEWRCSWCRYQDDVDPSLSSRNTLGNGKNRKLKISNDKCQMVVAESGGGLHLAMWEWSDGIYTVSELKAPSLSSRNTLGDTTHNTNKIGLSWGGGSVWWARLCGSGGGGSWWRNNCP